MAEGVADLHTDLVAALGVDAVLNERADLEKYEKGWRYGSGKAGLVVRPSSTEGYRTAEVTLGGVNTDEVSSKTMESKLQPGLYFIGEVLDVTGHLGGFNFQWAWSSGHAAGQVV